MNDFEYQLNYIKENSRRLISMQDRNIVSPAYGCFHYAYWRDKVTDFADARYQEAGAALGLLTHPAIYDSSMPSKKDLYASFSAAVVFWAKIQHGDGSFDEWYKNERGFAATEFSLIAFGLALYLLGDSVEDADRSRISAVIVKAADWLVKRNDDVKSNHEAAAAAALALAYRITGNEYYGRAAREKCAKVLGSQTDEGWFNEVAGMDLGYCSVLLDYMMLYHVLMSDDSVIQPMRKLYSFLYNFIHPDLTVSAEAGICFNNYLARLGTVLLSEHSPEAAAIARFFDGRSAGFEGIAPYLSDDLRLCRWGYLPIVTKILKKRMVEESLFAKAYSNKKDDKTPGGFFKKAAVFSRSSPGIYVEFIPAGGGAIKGYFNGELSGVTGRYEDSGYVYGPIGSSGKYIFTGGYKADRKSELAEDGMSAEVEFVPARFFFPPYIARLALRIACSIPMFSFYARKLIDMYRKMKGTAINQSAAPVADGKGAILLRRCLQTEEWGFRITDEIIAGDGFGGIDRALLRPISYSNGVKVDNVESSSGTAGNFSRKICFIKEVRLA
ncbi:MAG: hypothetical protein PHS46_03420 [Candidatus Omnitrophica bacterium]|nr:hypothetical protein [Candidatus Omnitrophota bacterium]